MSGPPPSLRSLESRLDARRLRQLAAGLLAYGVVGVVTLALIGYVGASSFGLIEPLGNSLESERTQLTQALHQTSVAIRDAATATTNAGGSLGQARTSASEAATLSRSLAVTMRNLASASQVSIFGSQPFGALGAGFGDAADQADRMAGSLDSIGSALGANSGDIGRVRGDLDTLAAQTDRLATTIEAMPAFAGPAAGASALRWAFLLLALWLAVPAVVALVAGAALWRWLGAHEGPGNAGRPRRRRWSLGRGRSR